MLFLFVYGHYYVERKYRERQNLDNALQFISTGDPMQSVEFPASRITSCCFGGKGLDELYVTSSAYEAPEEEMKELPLSGSLFRVKGLGVKGFPANVYEGSVTVQ